MSEDFKVQNFDLEHYKSIINTTNSEIHQNMAQYHTRFYETFRSNPMKHFHDYLYDTVKYGRYNGTQNRLLFGGEIDYITQSIYDVLAYIDVWRYFNVFNEVEYIKVRNANPEENLRLDQTFGIKYVINYRGKDAAFDREFETISSPKLIKNTLDVLDRYRQYELASDLYNRFKLFGFIDYIDSIDDIDEYTEDLQNESIGKKQVVTIDLGEFADINCWRLNSIYDYCTYIKADSEGLKRYYNDNLFSLSDDELKQFGLNKFQDVMYFAYMVNYPVLYNIKK